MSRQTKVILGQQEVGHVIRFGGTNTGCFFSLVPLSKHPLEKIIFEICRLYGNYPTLPMAAVIADTLHNSWLSEIGQ